MRVIDTHFFTIAADLFLISFLTSRLVLAKMAFQNHYYLKGMDRNNPYLLQDVHTIEFCSFSFKISVVLDMSAS